MKFDTRWRNLDARRSKNGPTCEHVHSLSQIPKSPSTNQMTLLLLKRTTEHSAAACDSLPLCIPLCMPFSNQLSHKTSRWPAPAVFLRLQAGLLAKSAWQRNCVPNEALPRSDQNTQKVFELSANFQCLSPQRLYNQLCTWAQTVRFCNVYTQVFIRPVTRRLLEEWFPPTRLDPNFRSI